MKPPLLLIIFFCLQLFACSNNKAFEIEKIDHIYVVTKDAQASYDFFKNQFQLPVVWDFDDWGSFKSGGLSLGNIVLEFKEKGSPQDKSLYGIAFAPTISLNIIPDALDYLNLSEQDIVEESHWSLIDLPDFLPEEIHLFICDYHNRSSVNQEREMANKELSLPSKNVLDIQSVKELTIGIPAEANCKNRLNKIPGINNKEDNFSFRKGPRLSLQPTSALSFGMILKVNNLTRTRTALKELGIPLINNEKEVQFMDQNTGILISFRE